MDRADELAALQAEVVECRRCPRLVEWRELVGRQKVARFRNETYWARPVPGFGDPDGRILVVGLAPAAHGGNRTGRIFTGDASGDFLWRALHAIGLANQPLSRHANDGLRVEDTWITAGVKCAPPANRPTPDERENCLPYLVHEIAILDRLRVVVALGAFGWDEALHALRANGVSIPRPRPRFGHGAEVALGRVMLLGTYHPSQQNTFTGKLTPPMFQAVLGRAVELAGADAAAVTPDR